MRARRRMRSKIRGGVCASNHDQDERRRSAGNGWRKRCIGRVWRGRNRSPKGRNGAGDLDPIAVILYLPCGFPFLRASFGALVLFSDVVCFLVGLLMHRFIAIVL